MQNHRTESDYQNGIRINTCQVNNTVNDDTSHNLKSNDNNSAGDNNSNNDRKSNDGNHKNQNGSRGFELKFISYPLTLILIHEQEKKLGKL